MTKEQFIYALTACGCLLKDGKTWYEHNELIECFENLGLFEQETKNCSDCEIVQACVEAGIRSTSRALDILDKIRAELVRLTRNRIMSVDCKVGLKAAINILDEYKAETEE